jgi:aspartate aminotransferase
MALDVSTFYPKGDDAQAALHRDLTGVAATMAGSRILGIAGQVKELAKTNPDLCNLTVGDFSPAEFPIPAALKAAIDAELAADETNYPPADGMPELRQAVIELYAERLGLRFPVESVVVGSGADRKSVV